MYVWMGGRVDVWMCGWVDGWMGGCVDVWMGGWVDGWMGGCVDGWMGGCTLANTPTCLAQIVRFASLERNECHTDAITTK